LRSCERRGSLKWERREQNEIGASAVPGEAERVGHTLFDLHCILQIDLIEQASLPGLAASATPGV
jgi:hypothetical protein